MTSPRNQDFQHLLDILNSALEHVPPQTRTILANFANHQINLVDAALASPVAPPTAPEGSRG